MDFVQQFVDLFGFHLLLLALLGLLQFAYPLLFEAFGLFRLAFLLLFEPLLFEAFGLFRLLFLQSALLVLFTLALRFRFLPQTLFLLLGGALARLLSTHRSRASWLYHRPV